MIIICMTYKGFCITAAFVIITIRFNEDSFNWNYQLVTVMHSDKRCYRGRIKGELQILHNYSHLHSWPVSVWSAVTVRWTLLGSMREVLFIYLLDRSCGFKWINAFSCMGPCMWQFRYSYCDVSPRFLVEKCINCVRSLGQCHGLVFCAFILFIHVHCSSIHSFIHSMTLVDGSRSEFATWELLVTIQRGNKRAVYYTADLFTQPFINPSIHQ